MNADAAIGVLSGAYDEYVAAFGLGDALTRELALEDDYQDHVLQMLRQVHSEPIADDYAGPSAFCGGGRAAQDLLRAVSTNMYRAGHQLPANALGIITFTSGVDAVHHPVMFCGLVPEGDLGVRTQMRPSGVVLFDVGLWFFLRLGVQAVAAELHAATGDAKWGTDDPDAQPIVRFRSRFDGYLRRGEGLRDNTHVQLMRGPREAFRRQLNYACIVWILGHEYGHLALPTVGPPPPMVTYSEAAEMWSQDVEFRADRAADALVRAPWFGIDPLAALFAPVVVHTLQAFILRTRHLAGDVAPYWTHTVPEMRAGMSLEALPNLGELAGDPRGIPAQYQAGRRFLAWLWAQMGTEEMFAKDVPEGISRR